jgi:hypothetical protein
MRITSLNSLISYHGKFFIGETMFTQRPQILRVACYEFNEFNELIEEEVNSNSTIIKLILNRCNTSDPQRSGAGHTRPRDFPLSEIKGGDSTAAVAARPGGPAGAAREKGERHAW